MNHPEFSRLRRLVDEAITFDDLPLARRLAGQGVGLAQKKELPGELFYFQAQMAVMDENFDQAERLLFQALSFNPKDGAAYNDIALCRIERGILTGIEEIFDAGIAVEYDYATIHHNKGWFLHKTGHHETALQSFRQALAFDADRAVTWENMADAYESLGRIPEALAAYKRALSCVREPFQHVRKQIIGEIERLKYAQN